MQSPQSPDGAMPSINAIEQQWLDDFTAAARSSCGQIALVVEALESAVGPERFAVVAPLYLRELVDTSVDAANLRLSERMQAQAMAQPPRPADPAWNVAPSPAIARYLSPFSNQQ